MLTYSRADKVLHSDFPQTTQFSCIYLLNFRKLHFFRVSLFNTLASTKHFRKSSPYTSDRNCVLNTMLPSDYSETTQFYRNYSLKFRKFQISAVYILLLIYISIWKSIISYIHITYSTFLPYTIFWISIIYVGKKMNFS